jgi:hypothetical protein
MLIEERDNGGGEEEVFWRGKGKRLIWLVRKWLNLPDCPVDDLSAQIISERFLKNID